MVQEHVLVKEKFASENETQRGTNVQKKMEQYVCSQIKAQADRTV